MLEFVKKILNPYEIASVMSVAEEIELRNMELERRVKESVIVQTRLRKAYNELEEKLEDLSEELSLCREFLRQEISGRKLDELLIQDSRVYADNLASMMKEPLLVLGSDLRVVSANASFYKNFRLSENDVISRSFFDLNDGYWNVDILRKFMDEVLGGRMDYPEIEIERDIPGVGHVLIRVNVRTVRRQENGSNMLLITFQIN